jgi:hypothetical protein
VYTVDYCNARVTNRALTEFGQIEFISKAWANSSDWRSDRVPVDVFMLEFEESNLKLTTKVRYLLDEWGFDKKRNIAEILGTDCPQIQHMLGTPDPRTPSLTWCVSRFKEYFPNDWDNFWTAVGQCAVVSQDFLSFMESKGAVTPEQVQAGYAHVHIVYFGDPRSGSPTLGGPEYHATVHVGGISVDWTHRQYKSDVPVPYIRRVRDLPPHMRYCRICQP